MSKNQFPNKASGHEFLASRAMIVDADDRLAMQLGGGKEANGRTNQPVNQTNPALFAAPLNLPMDHERNFQVV
jgi:hypothetical protein